MKRVILLAHLLLLIYSANAQEKFFVEKDLQRDWLMYREGYISIGEERKTIGNTLHFKVAPAQYPGRSLVLKSARPFFVFFNGKLSGEYNGYVSVKIDSLATVYFTQTLLVTVHQKNINKRDLKTWILSEQKKASSLIPPARPSTYFKDFVIVAGLMIIVIHYSLQSKTGFRLFFHYPYIFPA
jgi:hypothetical protein